MSAMLEYQVYVLSNGSLEILEPSPAPGSAKMANNTRYLGKDFYSNKGPIETTLVTMFALSNPSYQSFVEFSPRSGSIDVARETTFGQAMILDGSLESFQARDPLPAVIDIINNILLYAGTVLGTEHNKSTNSDWMAHVSGSLYDPLPYYFADWGYFGAAAGLEVLAILSVFCVLRDHRRLGRLVSLSPLEIARAFDAPLLQGVNTNNDVKDIIKQIGSTRIRYGVLKDGLIGGDRKDGSPSASDEGHSDRLVFAETQKVTPPAHMQTFGA